MRTEDLIIALAGSARPVRPLPNPFRRFARWALAATALIALVVIVMGPRPTVAADLGRPAFLGLALITFATALSAAAAALALSVPAGERTPLQRALPIGAALAWLLWLTGLLAGGGQALARLAAFPIHWGCITGIAGLAVVPGVALYRMIANAAPLRPGWTATLAAMASFALAAAGVQFICPIDDPAHHLDSHLLPAALFAAVAAVAVARALRSFPSVPGD